MRLSKFLLLWLALSIIVAIGTRLFDFTLKYFIGYDFPLLSIPEAAILIIPFLVGFGVYEKE